MNIIFLSKNQAKEYFKELDEYGLNLPESNLQMMNVKSKEEYHQLLLDSFGEFSDAEKASYTKSLESLNFLDLEIKLIKTLKTHQLDIIQTRKKAILVPEGTPPNNSLFVHEVFHILSRNFDFSTLYTLLGFSVCEEQVINDPTFLLNPDCVQVNQSIDLIINGSKKTVVPYLSFTEFVKLKEVGKDNYFGIKETNYSQIIKNTKYLVHPEEICAELFALSLTNDCIYKTNLDNITLKKFNEQLKYLCLTNGIVRNQK